MKGLLFIRERLEGVFISLFVNRDMSLPTGRESILLLVSEPVLSFRGLYHTKSRCQ